MGASSKSMRSTIKILPTRTRNPTPVTIRSIGIFWKWNLIPHSKIQTSSFASETLLTHPTKHLAEEESLDTTSSRTGRTPTAKIPSIRVLPDADVHFYRTDGSAIRGTRSNSQGKIDITGLIDISPGTKVIVNAFDGFRSESKVIQLED